MLVLFILIIKCSLEQFKEASRIQIEFRFEILNQIQIIKTIILIISVYFSMKTYFNKLAHL